MMDLTVVVLDDDVKSSNCILGKTVVDLKPLQNQKVEKCFPLATVSKTANTEKGQIKLTIDYQVEKVQLQNHSLGYSLTTKFTSFNVDFSTRYRRRRPKFSEFLLRPYFHVKIIKDALSQSSSRTLCRSSGQKVRSGYSRKFNNSL